MLTFEDGTDAEVTKVGKFSIEVHDSEVVQA